MTLDVVILIAQSACLFFLAAWLSTGVYENIFLPDLNETYTAQVLRMEVMEQEYPEAFRLVAHRRVESRAIQKLMFRLIVLWEALATLALWIGFLAMVLCIFGMVGVETARALALAGALMFTCTWAGFLVAGNWFCYWFGHEGGQNTHFQMTLWGMAVMIFLVAG